MPNNGRTKELIEKKEQPYLIYNTLCSPKEGKFKNTFLGPELSLTSNFRNLEVLNFLNLELINLLISELIGAKNNNRRITKDKMPKKIKPPKLSRRLIATAATGRWNTPIIPSIKPSCQVFLNP
jgi:hypothetical protein